jgi:hypothetical protein
MTHSAEQAGFLAVLFCLASPTLAVGLGSASYVTERPGDGSFPIVQSSNAATIYVDESDYAGVARAATNLQADIGRVTGVTPKLTTDPKEVGRSVIIVGTARKSSLIQALVKAGKLDVSGLDGKWESFKIQVVPKPFDGTSNALVIAGSDKRGAIYGVYDLSEEAGVSPWYWWADVPVRHREALFVKAGDYTAGPPAVKYRGIFINDEGPCLMTWARRKYGELNHKMYTNMFELILRLKGNYLWPAMWDNSFATDDPLNPKLADEYGVVIGTAHHEPMMRAWKEWERSGHRKGSWDYSKNSEILRKYWEEGVKRTKDYEKVVTIGMRGDGDEPMSETDSIALLEQVVAGQRQILGEVMQTNVETVPQVWALYKEVQGYYDKGMRVPDDVTLLWCDDNWGNVRRLPTEAERARAGGAGIYYHFDYVGGPRNYKWLNTIPNIKTWEQMNLAYEYGARRLWIVNVGDLKPLEFPMEFFLRLAWDPSKWPKERVGEFGKLWAEREFGPEHASEIAEIVSKYTKYNGRRKPELLAPDTFSLENYGEADRVLEEWRVITDKAERISKELPPEARDAFFELVLFPTKACAVVNELYIAVAKNRRYAEQGDVRANEYATRAKELFEEDRKLADYYNHELAGGKWNHMMDQTHIGYRGWQQPAVDVIPRVTEVADSNSPPSEKPESSSSGHSTKADPRSIFSGGTVFVEENGYVSIEADHFSRKTEAAGARWETIEDLGRTGSSMGIFPVTAKSLVPPDKGPCLEYEISLTTTGAVEVTSIVGPCLNFAPERPVRLGVSMDDEDVQVLTVVRKGYVAGDGNRDWEESVKDAARKVKSKHNVSAAGKHMLRVWMVDPGVTLQKLVVDCGGLKPSYLGPPESVRR